MHNVSVPVPTISSIQNWGVSMSDALEELRATLLEEIVKLPKNRGAEVTVLSAAIQARVVLSADKWAQLMSACTSQATKQIASAAQHAEMAELRLVKCDYSGAMKALGQAIFEAGEANGIIESVIARSSAAARARHAVDACEEADAHAYWKRNIKPMRGEISRETAAERLLKIVPFQLSTAKTLMRKWEKDEEAANNQRAAMAELKQAFPSLFADPKRLED